MLKRRVEEYERRLILSALASAEWSQRRAARALGVLPTTLHEKMKRLGIPGRPDGNAPWAVADDSPADDRVLEEFRWHGTVEDGQTLEISGITGTLKAEIGRVEEVEIVATKRGTPQARRSVVVKVSAARRGVLVIAQTLDGRPVGPEVTVDAVVRVPVGVRLLTRLPAGRLDTHGVHGVLELRAREEMGEESSRPGLAAPTRRIARPASGDAASNPLGAPASAIA